MKTLFAIASLFFALLLASCGAKTNVITNTYSTAEPGNVKGTVKLFDTNGVAISDASGVKVAMEGTSYSTLTAADGTWELQNVPAGTYLSLMYSKVGFPTYKSYQQSTKGNIGAYIIGGGGTQYDGFQDFYQISNISVDLVLRPFGDYKQITSYDTVIGSQYSTVYDTLVIPFGQATFSSRVLDNLKNKVYSFYGALFFGTDSLVDAMDPRTYLFSTAINHYLMQTDYVTGSRDFLITAPQLKAAGFKSGQTIYCASYFGNPYVLDNNYLDWKSGITIYPGFSPNHSEVRSFILP